MRVKLTSGGGGGDPVGETYEGKLKWGYPPGFDPKLRHKEMVPLHLKLSKSVLGSICVEVYENDTIEILGKKKKVHKLVEGGQR